MYLYDNGKLNDNRYGKEYTVEGGSVMTFDNEPPPASISLPTYPASLYTALNSYSGWTTPDPSGGTWKNAEVLPPGPHAKPLVITGNVTIEGVLYMRYGSSISFGDSSTKEQTLTINGAIIWEPAPTGTTPIPQTLTFGRYIGINTPDAATRDGFLVKVLGANATSTLLNGDIVAAPQTDLSLDSGNDVTGIKVFNGSLHVKNVNSEGSGDVLFKAPDTGGMVINGGGIVAEGNVILKGTTAFCVKPPDVSNVVVDKDRYRLAFTQTTYWEQ